MYCSNNAIIFHIFTALECPNTLAKKHMFELLTAVCVYSHLGHYRVLDALENFKVSVCMCAFTHTHMHKHLLCTLAGKGMGVHADASEQKY